MELLLLPIFCFAKRFVQGASLSDVGAEDARINVRYIRKGDGRNVLCRGCFVKGLRGAIGKESCSDDGRL